MLFGYLPDLITNLDISPRLRCHLQKLSDPAWLSTAPGRYELPDQAFLSLQRYQTVPASDKQFESHCQYIDIQYVLSGQERCDYIAKVQLPQGVVANDNPDLFFHPGDSSDTLALTLQNNYAAIFWPEDAHRPGLQLTLGIPLDICKIVVKVPVN